MEQVLRALENDHLRPDDVAHAQDIVEYLVESCCTDDELLHDLSARRLSHHMRHLRFSARRPPRAPDGSAGVYDDLALGDKLGSGIGRLAHKPKASAASPSHSESERTAATAARNPKVKSAPAARKPVGIPALRSAGVTSASAAAAVPASAKPSAAAPAVASIRVVPLRRVASEAEQQLTGTAAASAVSRTASTAGMSARTNGDFGDENGDVHTPGMEAAVACVLVGSSGVHVYAMCARWTHNAASAKRTASF